MDLETDFKVILGANFGGCQSRFGSDLGVNFEQFWGHFRRG